MRPSITAVTVLSPQSLIGLLVAIIVDAVVALFVLSFFPDPTEYFLMVRFLHSLVFT